MYEVLQTQRWQDAPFDIILVLESSAALQVSFEDGFDRDVRSALGQDREQVLFRALEAGVGAAVITGSSLASSQTARSLVDSPAPIALYFTAGVGQLLPPSSSSGLIVLGH